MDWFIIGGLVIGILGVLIVICMMPLLKSKYKIASQRAIVGGIGCLVIGIVVTGVSTDGWDSGVKIFAFFCATIPLMSTLFVLYRDYKVIKKIERELGG